MKILLINPPVAAEAVWVREGRCQQWDIWGAPFPPFSLAMISTQLMKNGHETNIIDSGPEGKGIVQVLNELKSFAPEIIILSTASPTIESDLAWFLPQAKALLPGCAAIAIGIHVTALPKEVLMRYPFLDYVIMGEPEIPAMAIVENLAGKSEISSAKNIAYRDSSGDPFIAPFESFTDDLDALGFPDWGKINFPRYLLPIVERPFSLIGFSRGCPYSCKFCAAGAYNGKKTRKRSIAGLIQEINFNLDLGVKDFLFWTELMTLDDLHLNEFLDALMESGLNKKISWVCNSRVDNVRLSTLKKMKDSGCWQIAFGLEFGSDEILSLAGKGGAATLVQARKAVTMASDVGLVVDGHFIMGYPGETMETLQATIDFASSLPLTFAHFYAAVPFPGSELYNLALENAWCAPGAWESFNQDNACITTQTLHSRTVDEYIAKAYKAFYLRPVIFLRVLKIPKNIFEFANILKLGWRFLMKH